MAFHCWYLRSKSVLVTNTWRAVAECLIACCPAFTVFFFFCERPHSLFADSQSEISFCFPCYCITKKLREEVRFLVSKLEWALKIPLLLVGRGGHPCQNIVCLSSCSEQISVAKLTTILTQNKVTNTNDI